MKPVGIVPAAPNAGSTPQLPASVGPAEFLAQEKHTLIGANILAGSRFPVLRLAEQIAVAHHERWDGTGYPHGLHGEEIPLSARIVSVADVFDALTHKRAYKPAWRVDDALAEIVHQRGAMFDPAVVDAFLAIVGEYVDTSELETAKPQPERKLGAPVAA